jgi:predicted DNA repair protein MutK
MATSLLLLIDDIVSVLDDVAAMTKVAAKKTAGVLGDDLALNAKQVTGVDPARELPVVWAVAKGSAINKVILVPAALLISWLAPWAIPPLLVVGERFSATRGLKRSSMRSCTAVATATTRPATAPEQGSRPRPNAPRSPEPFAPTSFSRRRSS